MNGAGPPDRAQPLGLSTLQGRIQAQTPCLVFSCEGPEERQRARGSRGGEATRSRALTYPPAISSCEKKAPRTMGGYMHESWPVSQSSATWV